MINVNERRFEPYTVAVVGSAIYSFLCETRFLTQRPLILIVSSCFSAHIHSMSIQFIFDSSLVFSRGLATLTMAKKKTYMAVSDAFDRLSLNENTKNQ